LLQRDNCLLCEHRLSGNHLFPRIVRHLVYPSLAFFLFSKIGPTWISRCCLLGVPRADLRGVGRLVVQLACAIFGSTCVATAASLCSLRVRPRGRPAWPRPPRCAASLSALGVDLRGRGCLVVSHITPRLQLVAALRRAVWLLLPPVPAAITTEYVLSPPRRAGARQSCNSSQVCTGPCGSCCRPSQRPLS